MSSVSAFSNWKKLAGMKPVSTKIGDVRLGRADPNLRPRAEADLVVLGGAGRVRRADVEEIAPVVLGVVPRQERDAAGARRLEVDARVIAEDVAVGAEVARAQVPRSPAQLPFAMMPRFRGGASTSAGSERSSIVMKRFWLYDSRPNGSKKWPTRTRFRIGTSLSAMNTSMNDGWPESAKSIAMRYSHGP